MASRAGVVSVVAFYNGIFFKKRWGKKEIDDAKR
jgi:hypothetical protein